VVGRGGVVDWGGLVVNRGRLVVDGGGLVVDGSGYDDRLVSRSRDRLVSRSRGGLVGGSRGRFVGSGFGVGGFSFVFHISDVTFGTGRVSDDLDTAVGKVDTVFAAGGISVAGLLLREGGFGVVVGDAILVAIDGGGIRVDLGSGVVGGGRAGGRNGGDEGETQDLRSHVDG